MNISRLLLVAAALVGMTCALFWPNDPVIKSGPTGTETGPHVNAPYRNSGTTVNTESNAVSAALTAGVMVAPLECEFAGDEPAEYSICSPTIHTDPLIEARRGLSELAAKQFDNLNVLAAAMYECWSRAQSSMNRELALDQVNADCDLTGLLAIVEAAQSTLLLSAYRGEPKARSAYVNLLMTRVAVGEQILDYYSFPGAGTAANRAADAIKVDIEATRGLITEFINQLTDPSDELKYVLNLVTHKSARNQSL